STASRPPTRRPSAWRRRSSASPRWAPAYSPPPAPRARSRSTSCVSRARLRDFEECRDPDVAGGAAEHQHPAAAEVDGFLERFDENARQRRALWVAPDERAAGVVHLLPVVAEHA